MAIMSKNHYRELTVLSCEESILQKNGFPTLFFDIILVGYIELGI